jgi:AmmeMemoRadiSam system protein B
MDPVDLCNKTHQVYSEVDQSEKVDNPLGIISPHAGWQYSGIVTATALEMVQVPDLVILLGNNHKDNGRPYAVWTDLPWAFPFGNVSVDQNLAEQFVDEVDLLEADHAAHLQEHSNEIQVVWLHHKNPDLRIVPIAIDNTGNVQDLLDIGEQIAGVLENVDEPYLIIMSTDLTHYKNYETVEEQDQQMIDEMLKLDPEALFLLVKNNSDLNMCGLEPVVAGMQAILTLGASKAVLAKYRTSYEAFNSNPDSTVGYASIVITK